MLIVVVCVVVGLAFFAYRFASGHRRGRGGADSSAVRTQGLPVIPSPMVHKSSRKAAVTKAPVKAAPPRKETASAVSAPVPAAAPVVAAPVAQVAGISAEEGRRLIVSGQGMETAGDLLGARKVYAEALNRCSAVEIRRDLEERLGRVNIGLLLSPRPMPEMTIHKVTAGEKIEKMAKSLGTTKELVLKSNGIPDPRRIQIGQALKICTGKFSIVVSKQKYELVLRMNGEFFKRYPVGLGAMDKTPVGSFVVTSRDINPTWWPPEGGGPIPPDDPRNLLGTRWLATKDEANPAADKRGLGIHGTKDESSIGKSMSHGCIRMFNRDVEELHMIVPEGTPVTITE